METNEGVQFCTQPNTETFKEVDISRLVIRRKLCIKECIHKQ